MSQRNYSLRQRLDIIFGALVVILALEGTVSLGLTQRQQHDARFLNALREQERLAYELTWFGALALTESLRGSPPIPDQVGEFRTRLTRLEQNLRVLQNGGTLALDDQRALLVQPVREPAIAQQLGAALASIERYRVWFERLSHGEITTINASVALSREVIPYGYDLRALIHGLTGESEQRSLATVIRSTQLQLVFMGAGFLVFLLGVFFLRSFVTTPLHRLAEGIEAMQRTGRLVKLPVMHTNELGVLASGFNQLTEHVEEQKRRLRDHIVELQRVNIELDQLTNLKDDFLMTINHQLRTPLTAIIEGIGLIQDGTTETVSEQQLEIIHAMRENAKRLTHLVEEALDLSMLKSGRRPLERRAADLTPVLRQIRAQWNEPDPLRTIQLTHSELPAVYMDTQAIEEVLNHLLRNALRHAPEHSEVVMQAHTRDGVIEVSIHDQGAGMSSDQVEKLFQPFVHVHTPDAPGSEGGGIGLAFCRQVVERHRGVIQVDSLEGKGTTVSFTLPVASPSFLFQEACHSAQEQAQYERGQFTVFLVRPITEYAVQSDSTELMRQAESVLRQNTHRGDRFIWLDEMTLAIVAVTDDAGRQAMEGRLQGLLKAAKLGVHLTSALSPLDGETPERLLEVARMVCTTS